MSVKIRLLAVAFVGSLGMIAGTDEYWNNPSGGSFQNASDWLGNATPSSSGSAIFDLDSTYTITFAADAETGLLRILDDEVTFDLNGFTYSVDTNTETNVFITSDPAESSNSSLIITNGTFIPKGVTIADDAGSNGFLRITGAGANWDSAGIASGRLIIGYSGHGAMEVLDGATVAFEDNIQLALLPGSSGSLLLRGSGTTFTNVSTMRFTLGYNGHADLEISQQAQGFLSTMRIARNADASATILVTDPGTYLETRISYLGREGVATMTVQAGAEVQCTNGFDIAEEATAEGHLLITDPGTTFDANGSINLRGNGDIRILNLALVTTNGVGANMPEGTTGEILIDGPNTTLIGNGGFSLRGDGNCDLTVRNGAVVFITSNTLITDHVTPLITGPGTHWICLSDFAVADQDGVAVLNVNEGADVESLDLYIGSGLNADGTIVIADVATDWDMRGSLYVGQNANLAATLTIRDGASMTLDSAFIADGDNTTGVVELVGPGCSFQTDGSFSLGVGTGLGAFSCSDDDTVVIGGDYFQNDASSLTVSISSLVDAPIIVGGNAILGGTLNLVLEPGFETPLGTEYQLMTAASVSDAFIVVNQDAMPSGNFFIVSYEPTRVRLIVVDEIIPGDVNYNGTVDVTDLLKLLEAWGSCPGCNEDVNGDGVVSVLDLLTLLASWT